MADNIELVIKIPKEEYSNILKSDNSAFADYASKECMMYAIKNGTPLLDIEKMLSSLDLSMSYVLESDHRSFTNPVTENGWLFDKIIDWRKMIQPYIKEEA